MADTTPFTIGADASCADGVCGEVSRVVVDPVARAVTHLVVEPKGRQGLGRLVPLDLVDAAGGAVRLRCTVAEFERLDSAEETQFLPGTRATRSTAQNRSFPGRTPAWAMARAWRARRSPGSRKPPPLTPSPWARW